MKHLLIHYVVLLYFPMVNMQLVKIQGLVQMCDSMIYCQGPILEAVNYFQIYNDSKEYVDKPLIKTPIFLTYVDDTLHDFYKAFPNFSSITVESLKSFLATHFLEPGYELLPHSPKDWSENPLTFDKIKDKFYLEWAKNLNHIWKQLCKKVDSKVSKKSDRYSLIYLQHPFVIPGGRFRENYYWDAFWIVKGLLVSQMFETTKLMIRNYVDTVNSIGFIPNGGRVYYLKRSQPPLLTSMVYSYYKATHDKAFLVEVLPTLEKELSFWLTNRSVDVTLKNGKTYQLYQYNTPSTAPRPESYRQDVKSAKGISEADKPNFWSNIASAAESGWDFSSRWFKDRATMKTIMINRLVPADLNAFICGNLKILSKLYRFAGDSKKSANYQKQFNNFQNLFMKIFYNTMEGVWFDYNLDTNLHNVHFYPSNLSPLYTRCYYDNHPMGKILVYLGISQLICSSDF